MGTWTGERQLWPIRSAFGGCADAILPIRRNNLREAGLIRDDIMLVHLQHTPRSIWEITEKGRQWLRKQDKSVGT
jgi:hypothetical protein